MDFTAIASGVLSAAKRINEDGIGIDLNSFTSSQPRGLYNFISDIRAAKSKEDERIRVDKELGNIRAKFANSSSLSSRDKKKYIWKMCYIYMLGYEIDFGHTEFISLISSTKFQEKSVGYMAFSLMIRPGDELMTLLINSMRNDIIGPLVPGKTLALAAVSNVGGNDLSESLASDVQKLIGDGLESGSKYANLNASIEEEMRNKCLLTKKASLCLLRLFRTNPECIMLDDWVKRMARLLESRDFGVVISVMSLLLGLASHSKQLFEPIVPYVISVLNRLTISASCPVDYLYYRTPCPWLQVKCLRFLQYYKLPTDETHQSLLLDVLRFIAEKTGFSDHSANKSNADHAILFEVINLAILLGADAPEVLKEHVCTLLGRFIALNDANIKYLGLDAMTRLAKIDGPKAMQVHQTTVLELLKDTDVSVRKRALDLVYVLTDGGNARVIVGELLANLAVTDSSIKEDFVVKIAILAENFSHDLQWYVSTMVQVLQVAGDFVAEAVWYRVVQIITNHPEVHESAAVRLMASIEPKYAHDSVVAVAAYLLGEIGVTICELPGMSGHDQFLLLNQHFLTCSAKVQSIILSAFMKLLNLYPEQTADEINAVFNKYSTHVNLELQQRSCEYLALPSLGADVMENVMNPMPPFEMQDKSRNVLLTMVGTSHEKGVNADMTAFTEVVRGGKDPTISAAATTSASSSPSMPELKKPQTSTPTKVLDLLSMDDDDALLAESTAARTKNSSMSALFREVPQSPGSNEAAVELSADLLELHAKALKAAALTRVSTIRSILLQNDILKITVCADYRAHQGRLSLLFENVSSFDLLSLKVFVELEPSSENAITFKQLDPPSMISVNDEGRMQVAVDCMRPFSDLYPVKMRVSFMLANNSYKYRLKLPLCLVSFFDPIPTDKATYMSRWKSIEGEGTEGQVVFSSGKPVDAALMQYLKTVFAPSMRLGIAEGLDSDRTLTGCCSFLTGTMGADGAAVSVGVLMRLEGDSSQNKFRITTRSKNRSIAQGLKDFIVEQLS